MKTDALLKTLTFRLTCPETRAWLVLKGGNGGSQIVEMRRAHTNVWSASADLIPGEYECRYYVGDEKTVIYYGPAHIDGGVDCGMDTLVSVKILEDKRDPQFIQ
jgi:hypothetical protein